MPVHHGMVDAELETLLVACIRQGLEQVLPFRGDCDVPVIVHLRGPEAEPIMMFRGDADIFDPRSLHQAHPFPGIVFRWLPAPGQRAVLGTGNLQILLNPFRTARHGFILPLARQLRIQAPMDEHAKLRIPEPLHAGIPFRLGFLECRRAWG